MNQLIKDINKLRQSNIKTTIDNRIQEFKALNKKTSKEWFSELCFCLLTANTSAEMGIRIQKELGYEGFTKNKTEKQLIQKLKKARSRFYNRRGHFIFEANKHKDIKSILNSQKDKREWLTQNIKGLSYKEASHFLRNIGFFQYAIIDKHILRLLKEHDLIKEIPNNINTKTYIRFENILEKLSKKVNVPQGELDLYLWYMKTKKVLK